MVDALQRGSINSTLRSRAPAYSVMRECLRVQALQPEQGKLAHFFGARPVGTEARSWYKGALGELEVARVLSGLGARWTVLHSVPFGSGDSDIDHILIGPPGVFTVNTKNHPDKKIWIGGNTLSINGQKTFHIRNSRSEADRASQSLTRLSGQATTVTPVIVIVGSASITMGKVKSPVTVLTVERLGRWLSTQPTVQSDAAVESLSRIAEQRGTWHTKPAPTDDTLRHVQRFERLQREMQASYRRRILWAIVASIAISATICVLLLQLPPILFFPVLIGILIALRPAKPRSPRTRRTRRR